MKHIVITGATKGLGKAMAEWFISAGHTVSGCGRDAAAVDNLRNSHSRPHEFDVVDVSDAAQVNSWAAKVISSNGAPDLLINNAAVINANLPLWEVPADQFSHLIDINIKGVFLVTRAFLPAMIRVGHGVVVNLSSGWGRSVSPQVAPYCTSKWAIEGMTRALAAELPGGLAAIPLNPGMIYTDMLRSCFGEEAAGSPTPQQWVRKAGPMILNLTSRDNGKPLTV